LNNYIKKLCTKQVTDVKVVNNLIYEKLSILDFQTKIPTVKTKHHMSRTCCKTFSSISWL